eukprot:3968401-Prorocentrum_lima.AAC.1
MNYRDHAGIPKIVLKKVVKKRTMTYLDFPKELKSARWVSGLLREYKSGTSSRQLTLEKLLACPPTPMSPEVHHLLQHLDLKSEQSLAGTTSAITDTLGKE